MLESVFLQLSVIIIVAVIISAIMKLLRQPLIIGYIITGIVAGPYVLNMVSPNDAITTFSRLGITFLLFIAGLSLSPKSIKTAGKAAVVTAVGQMFFTSIIGFSVARLLGFSTLISIYIGVALTFSSTIIIIKLLSDKGDLDSLYGKISIGFLIVQDIVAVIALMVVSSFSTGAASFNLTLENVLIGVGVLALVGVFGLFALPKAIKSAAKSQEFLFFLSLGWLLLLSIVFGYLNFSIEIGALIAGITLSASPYHYEIKIKMKTLRDFFVLFFFVLLGSQMVLTTTANYIVPIVLFSAFIMVVQPLIVIVLMGLLKYTKRTGFMFGFTIGEISEFSFILVALGVTVGHLTNSVLSMITAIGLITIFGSSYMITYSEKIYSKISRHLSIFERSGRKVDEHSYHKGGNYSIFLFGCDRIGFSLLDSIKKLKKRALIVDYNPEMVISMAKRGYECRYGDVNDVDFLHELGLSKAKMVISTIPNLEANLILVETVREKNKNAIIFVASHDIDDTMKLYNKGATYVMMPYFLGGDYTAELLDRNGLSPDKFLKERDKHIKYLKARMKWEHKHPPHKSQSG